MKELGFIMSETKLFYKKAAKEFEEALPLGNGRLGAMVFGNLKKERIALNEDSLWSGDPSKELNTLGAYKHLPKLQNAIFDGDFEKAKSIANSDFHGHWTESYLPFGDLIITYKSKIPAENYRRELNLKTGVATVKTSAFCEEAFVSYPAGLIVVNIKSQAPVSCEITFKSKLKSTVSAKENALIIKGKAPTVCYPPYDNVPEPVVYGDGGMTFAGIAKLSVDAEYKQGKITVLNKKEFTIFLSLATSFVAFDKAPTADSVARAKEYLKNIKNYSELKAEHVADFGRVFNRVTFTLDGGENAPTDKRLKHFAKGKSDNNLISLLFNFGRYLAISASRKGTNATNLQGIWNEHLRAPWSSNYTTNINTEMNYWGFDLCNLSDCFDPLTALVKKFAVKGEKTAKEYYGARGFCLHHNTDIWGNTNPAGYPNGDGDATSYAIWQTGLPWLLNMLYDHYLYIKDESYKAEILPLFEGCLAFYNDFLVKKDGELLTCPSISPENTFEAGGKRSSLTYMPSMDREILHDFFINCRALGLDAPEIDGVKPASDGRIPEWCEEYREKEPHHRHLSHLYCIYPSAYECADDVKEAAKKSLETRGDGGTGWSLAWKVCLWARLGDGDRAEHLIRRQLTPISAKTKSGPHGGSYPNLFDAHPPFQIDGNFGVMAGIAEMIKNNAMPKSWCGYVDGLKLKDGTTLKGKIENGLLIRE